MSQPTATASGIVRIASSRTVTATADRLESLLREHGIIVFARIDFAADASRAGLTMAAEQLLVFGNPRAGTPLMKMTPTVGLDLPLKALVWEDASGTWIAYNDPAYLAERHGLSTSVVASLAAAIPLIERAAQP
jgi:uncharacterized protein (DUF302 family)